MRERPSRFRIGRALHALTGWLAALGPLPSQAAFLSGDLLDTAADWMALFVIS